MPDIQDSLRALADQFVKGVLVALSSASLAELSALSGKGRGPRLSSPAPRARAPKVEAANVRRTATGRRARRSSEDVVKLADDVVAFVKQSGGNVAVSDIAKGIGVGTAEINRPVAIALKEGRIQKQGEKRLTRYFAGKKKKLEARSPGPAELRPPSETLTPNPSPPRGEGS